MRQFRVQGFGTEVSIVAPADTIEFERRQQEISQIYDMFLASRALPQTGLCLDIGAGAGWFALPFARAFPSWQVLCFEADPDSFAALSANVAQSGLKNIICVNANFHPALPPRKLARRTPGSPLPSAILKMLKRCEMARFQPLLALGPRLAPLASDSPQDDTLLRPALPLDLLDSLTPDLIKLDAPGCEQAIADALKTVPVGFLTGQLYSHAASHHFAPAPKIGAREYYLVAGEHALRRDYEDNFDTRQARLDVVVAMYNTRDFIRDCVDSVLADENPDIRVLVVDDGSTDGSGDLVAELYRGNPRVRLLSKDNGGCASARNFGRMNSNATHIAFIDADDRVDPGLFTALLEVARYTGAFVTEGEFEFFSINAEGAETLTPSYETELHPGLGHHRLGDLSYRWLPGEMIATGQPTIWRRVHRRDFLDRQHIWFPEHVRAFDDQIFQLLVSKYCGTLAHVHGYAYHYRQHAAQDIKQGDERHFYSFNMFRAVLLRALDEGWDNLSPVYTSLLNTISWSHSGLRPDLKEIYAEAAAEFLATVGKAYTHHFSPDALHATGIPGLDFLVQRRLEDMRDTSASYALMRLESWRWQPEFIRMMHACRT